MSKKANPTLIGVFVIVSCFLFLSGLVLFGSGKFFQKRHSFVAFFEGSVKGLKVGAPLAFRGVKVGEVSEVRLHLNIDSNGDSEKIYIPVVVDIIPENITQQGTQDKTAGDIMQKLIERGLRARLEMESFVTGMLYINLDYHPKEEAKTLGLDHRYTEIPTIPSTLQEISSTLEQIPVNEMVKEVQTILQHVRDAVASPQFDELMVNASSALVSAKTAMESGERLFVDLEKRVAPNLQASLVNAKTAFSQVEKTFASANGMIGKDAEMRYEMEQLVDELNEASRAVKNLAQYLDRNPDALLIGKRGVR